MTMDEIRESTATYLIPADIAPVLGCDPYSINIQAKECPERLGFAVCMIGRNVKVPRKAFLYWMEYGRTPVEVRG